LKITGRSTNTPIIFVFNGRTDIANTDLTAYIYQTSGSPLFAYLLLRLQAFDLNNGYVCRIEPAEAAIYRIQDGTWTLLAGATKPDTKNVWARYKFRVKGTHLELYQEEGGSWKKVVEADDDAFSSGAAGFGMKCFSTNDYTLYFDDVQISEEA